MIFRIKQRDLQAFKIWLVLLGYVRKDLADGGATFKGKGTKLDYVLIDSKMSGNSACQKLYEEFKVHLVSPLDVKLAKVA
ncbi:hypothetical protein [Acinetobacter sp. Ver3]|uniref:hypothetical protein n=1 Tax=Acinetobacter sp. Ver3 TaxID=466088 RepID=UPI00045103B2|nr:hypothetical protein [Acinetobacter sp. Ver3]EZQ10768.1 hypothetical protein CL42_06485 [Acinetobacter sp. Ver3]